MVYNNRGKNHIIVALDEKLLWFTKLGFIATNMIVMWIFPKGSLWINYEIFNIIQKVSHFMKFLGDRFV